MGGTRPPPGLPGIGIGGEYAAINSAIDEMIPARYRGRIDIAVNGTYWGGAIIGTLGSLLLLRVLSPHLGWRLGFLIGPVLGLVTLLVRRNLPESPRCPTWRRATPGAALSCDPGDVPVTRCP